MIGFIKDNMPVYMKPYIDLIHKGVPRTVTFKQFAPCQRPFQN